MRCGVIIFPGSNCDRDIFESLSMQEEIECKYIYWHETSDFVDIDCIILPGGFSYGDYLRAGKIACFTPVIGSLLGFARKGGLILGICNGFQILLELGLLPGAMLGNRQTKFICKDAFIKTLNNKTPFTNKIREGEVLKIPIAHKEGNYYCKEDTLKLLEDNEQIIFKYSDGNGQISDCDYGINENGSISSIAGITDKKHRILGMMPHPERATDILLGSTDGRWIFESLTYAIKLLKD